MRMKNLQWGRPSSILEMYVMVSIIAFAILSVADGVEWDCAASTNTGTFTRSSDCTISGTNDGVDVTGTLEIVGSSTDMDNLVTINAASKKRHFYVDGANDKLVLRYVKLVGGDVSSYSGSLMLDVVDPYIFVMVVNCNCIHALSRTTKLSMVVEYMHMVVVVVL